MIILSKLEIEGFRSFKDRTIISFPESGAILIRGKYKNKNISSGTGKSSILLAIAYALGFCSVPATALKNWDSKSLFVNLILRDTESEDVYEIIRSPKLQIKVNGIDMKGDVNEIEQLIQKIIKTPSELAKVLTYREQRKPGVFINSTDAKKKDFLSTVLGLYEIENALSEFNKELNNFKVQQGSHSATAQTLENVLTTSVVSDEEINQAKSNFEQLQIRLNEILNNKDKIQELTNEKLKATGELTKIQQVKINKNSATSNNQNIKATVMRLKKEVEKLQENICPTCQREWDNSEGLAEHKKAEIEKLIELMKENIAVIKNSDPIIASEPTIQQQITKLDTAIANLQTPAQDARNACISAKSNYEHLRNKQEVNERTKTSLKEAKTNLENTNKDICLTELAVNLIGRNGFLGSIFDETLIDIENRTNYMIARIPNVDNFMIKFPSTKVVSTGKNKGTVKKDINTEIYKSGKKIPIKALSGGQECAFELCSDLATAGTIRDRSGSKLGWVALDEAMDGLDVESKTFALEAIREMVNGQLLIIDHSTEVKEGFEKVIEVEYDGRNSYIIGES